MSCKLPVMTRTKKSVLFLLTTNLTHFLYVFIYFISPHVSNSTVFIIRRSIVLIHNLVCISLCRWLLGIAWYCLIVINTWFEKPKRRLYTWKTPGYWSRHQLDCILVKHRFRNSVKDVQTLPGADIDSNHNLLVAKVRTRLKKIMRFQKSRPRWDLEKL